MPTLVWFISANAPDAFYKKIRNAGYADVKALLPVLLKAQAKGWVYIVGRMAQEPRDVNALIQEHFDAATLWCKEAGRKTTRKIKNVRQKRME